MIEFIKAFLATVVAVAVWGCIIAILLLSLKTTQEAIKLDPTQWHCEALDPADGQCATYTKNHTE